MSLAVVTGSSGLVGSETVKFLKTQGMDVVGIDNDMRKVFFGKEASTAWNLKAIKASVPGYVHYSRDIRDENFIRRLFKKYGRRIDLIVHTAGQPSHDWAARDPLLDFTVNAEGTLNLLQAARLYCPGSVFIFTSTNKVYGDRPNGLPLVEHETRWELDPAHPYARFGIDETMSIDRTKHSLFGVSKVSADLMVQEYGAYFGMKTVCFRAGCITGPAHSGAALHGFLAYLLRCVLTDQTYHVIGYKGKQVRDNIHCFDLVNAFWAFYRNPKAGEVYNMGGSRHSNCSVLEAVRLCEQKTGRALSWDYRDDARSGDHIWWISDVRKFQRHYPRWAYRYDLEKILDEMVGAMKGRYGRS